MAGFSIVNIVATTLILAAVAANGRVLIGTHHVANAGAAGKPVASTGAAGKPVAATGATGEPVGGNPLAHICDDLTFTKVCEGLKKTPGVTTPRSLLEAAVRVSLKKARAAQGKFAKATKSSRAGNPMASILQSCTGNYDDLVSALEEAERSIQTAHGSNYDVVTKMTAASTFAGDCQNWFEERSMESPFQAMQRQVARVVSIALGIAAKTNNL